MTIQSLMEIIGDDADLLARSDVWLDVQQAKLEKTINENNSELAIIKLAKQLKIILQEKNMVALQQLVKDDRDEICNIVIRVVSLPDAIAMMEQPETILDEINAIGQAKAWESDGYDIETSKGFRPK